MYKQNVTDIYRTEPMDNGLLLAPPMGWNSWNYFKHNINEKMFIEMAKAIREKGLLDAGYSFLNLDDYWEDDKRDPDGKLQADPVRFPNGMQSFVQKINEIGFKVGIYSSNGTMTCQGLPASLGKEYMDACQFARWGIEYLKYDYCYHKMSTRRGPQIFCIGVTEKGSDEETIIGAEKALLEGTAKLAKRINNYHGCMPEHNKKSPVIVGLDANKGSATFLYQAEKEGEYYVTVHHRYPVRVISDLIPFEIMGGMIVNDGEPMFFEPGKTRRPCHVPPVRFLVKFKKGNNTIRIFNPIGNRADSAMINYLTMSNALIAAVQNVSAETGVQKKPIAFSVCEWGRNKPWEWGSGVANLWRTTGDISWTWKSIMRLYEINVKLYAYASSGHWNDPDMLEVGNGDLTLDENRAHFSLWCMMAAPLLLGNDVTTMKQEHLDIILNKNLIAIDQDTLGKQAKRIQTGKFDVLVRPLSDGSIALLVLNKKNKSQKFSFDLSELSKEEYVASLAKEEYTVRNEWTEETTTGKTLEANVPAHGVMVWKLF